MKKILSALIVAAMAATSVIGLTACVNDENGGKTDKTEGAQSAVRTTVTAEEWATAFDLPAVDNMTVKIIYSDAGHDERSELIYEYDGNKWHQTVTGDDSRERYYNLTNGRTGGYTVEHGCERYRKDGNAWKKDSSSCYFDDNGHIEISTAFAFASFTYSEADKAYKSASCTATVGSHGDFGFTDVVVKFEDGKLVYVEHKTADMGRYTVNIKLSVYDYGTTAVTLPTVSE